MKLFRARPVVVEAVQWDGTNKQDVREFSVRKTGGPIFIAHETGDGWYAEVFTGSDWVKVRVGDFIVKDQRGEFYPCDPDVFLSKYEAVNG